MAKRNQARLSKAFVVPKSGKRIDPEEIKELCRQSLSFYAIPNSVELVGQLPKMP